MTEFIITTLKFSIGDPDRDARLLEQHAIVDPPLERLIEGVRVGSQGPHPDLSFHAIANAVDRVLQSAIAVGVGLEMPGRRIEGRIAQCLGVPMRRWSAAGSRARVLARDASRMLVVGMRRLALAR